MHALAGLSPLRVSAVRVVELLDEGGDVERERVLQRADVLLLELGEGADVVAAQDLTVAHHVWEIACVQSRWGTFKILLSAHCLSRLGLH